MTESTRGLIFALGRAQMLARLLQLLTPIVLTRLLDVSDFGYYRFFWLTVNSVMAFAPLGLPRSLFYFLPRAVPHERVLYVNHAVLSIAGVGLVVAVFLGPWGPIHLPMAAEGGVDAYVLPVFVVLWTASFLVEVLPTADEQVRWQATSTSVLALLRAGLVLGTAWYTRDVGVVLAVLLAYAALRLVVLLWYVCRRFGCRIWVVRPGLLESQLRYSLPFGVTAGIENVRGQVDQWVVAALFSTGAFAVFSVAGLASQLVEVVRSSVVSVILPRINRAQDAGDVGRVVHLNRSSNVAIGAVVLPFLAFLFVFAEPVIEVLFTTAYRDAVPAMRLYVLGMAVMTVEMTSVLAAFNQGAFVVKLGASLFVLSALASYAGALLYGMGGAALGTLVGVGADCAVKLAKVSTLTGVRLREVQDWGGIAAVFVSAGVSAGAGGQLVNVLGPESQVVAVLLGGLCSGVLYLVLLAALGRGWLIAAGLGRAPWAGPGH